MLRHAVPALTLMAALALLPGAAHANEMRVTSYQIDEATGIVELSAVEALGDPWLRVDGRLVRVWFPHLIDVVRFDQTGSEDERIRLVQLRPGASDTAVLRVQLADGPALTTKDVEIRREGERAIVRIALPPLPKHAAKPAPTVVSAAASAKEQVPAQPTAAAANPVTAGAVAAPVAAVKPTAAALNTKAASKGLASAFAPEPTSSMGGSRAVLLIVISLVLGAVYGLLRNVQKRGKRKSPLPDIQVIGAKRLGARHQLILVRALGEDHLLSCNGGRTERLASMPSPHELGADTDSPLDEPNGAASVGLLDKLSSKRRMRLLFNEIDSTSAADALSDHHEPRNREEIPPFGAELLSFVRTQSMRPAERLREVQRDTRSSLKESEAVAGITRLRNRSAS